MLLGEERGVALPMALIVMLILALLIVTLAEITTAELEIERRTFWDTRAQYLAQAGVEHQIYALKGNKDAGSVWAVNFPATPGQEYWYTVTRTCLSQLSAGDPAVSCTANRETRRWEINSTGEVRRRNPDLTFTVLQTRSLRVWVEIRYSGTAPDLYRFPVRVTVHRWEEAYPSAPGPGDVTCTGVLGAVTVDNVTVPPGATCTLNGTQVNGNVDVQPGATLNTNGASVAGNIQADGSGSINLSGGTVGGNVQLQGKGPVLISNLTINGDVDLQGTSGGSSSLASNQVNGNFKVDSHTGGINISTNTIGGNLDCVNNSPAPTGGGNTAASKVGQCSTL